MTTNTYSKVVQLKKPENLWAVWTDVNNWNKWQDDLEFAKLENTFSQGEYFNLRPKGGPTVRIQLLEVIPGKSFTDLTTFPLAKMYGRHDFIQNETGIEIKTTMSIQGPLAFLWKLLVYNGIVAKLESQTDALIQQVQSKN